ncbi:MAG: LPS export ABC transporter ATP-binding protein [Bdellovibrionales bacterium]|nr:LPS export ABC transporter ATP-binding protein [Bdellovibrionales bacterium]
MEVHTLRTDSITKYYSKRPVVKEVCISVASGEIVGLLGPNGAGKTTSFYMCVGLVAPSTGHVYLDDEDITKDAVYQRARKGIGYLPQEPSVFRKLTVEENVLSILETMPLNGYGTKKERLNELLEMLGVTELRKSIASSLSGGERRRVEIARALALNPYFLLLDEPFAGIDPIAVKDLQEIIRQLKSRGIGTLITDHNVQETLGICDRAYILVDGKVMVEGVPDEIAADPDARRFYLGEDFRLI